MKSKDRQKEKLELQEEKEVQLTFDDLYFQSKPPEPSNLKDQDLLELPLRFAEVGTWEYDLASEKIRFNEIFERLMGFEGHQEERTVEEFRSKVHPEDIQILRKDFAEAFETGGTVHSILRLIDERGEVEKWLSVKGSAFYNPNNKPIRAFGILQDVTQGILLEGKLKESEFRFRQVSEYLPHIVWTMDGQGSVDYTNENWMIHTGLDFHQVREGEWLYAIHPEDRESAAEKRAKAMEAGEAHEIELRIWSVQEKSYRWYLWKCVPNKDENNQIQKWFGTLTDIHEQKTAADRIRETEEKLRAVIAHAPVILWALDKNLVCTLAEGKSLEEFNVEPSDIIGLPHEYIFGEDSEEHRNAHRALSGEVFVANEKISSRVFETHYSPIRDADGEITGVMAVSIDITQHKTLESALELLSKAGLMLSRTLDLDQTLKALGQLIVPQLGDWCTIDLVNEKGHLERALLYDGKQGLKDDGLVKFDRQSWQKISLFKRVLETKNLEMFKHQSAEALAGLGRSVSKEGGLYDVACVPLITRGQVIGILTVVTDSDLRPMKNETNQLISEVAYRAAFAIENAKLYKASQKASEAKSLFLANISHEMRTPLGIIHGFSELSLDPELPDAERFNYIETIKRNTEQLTKLINDVLDLSKIEADRLEVELMEFSITGLLKEIQETLNLKAAEKSLRLVFSVSDQLPEYLISDPTKIRQIFTNVVGNAIKFTEHGQVEVKVAPIFNIDRDTIELEIFVKDTGIGMSNEQKEKLFQPFSQGDVSMTRRFGGTGLGLLISKKLAQALGGDLEVHSSDPKEGTVFRIHFLAKLPKSVSAVKSAELIRVPTEDHLDGMKVLLVEDAPDNQALISRYLEMAGAQVQIANDGAEGVSKALHDQFDAVLMDIQMPIMDGYEALHKLQSTHFEKPVIALTAHAMREEREHALQEGFAEYLTKPIRRSDLVRVLKEVKKSFHH